jgi:hypothetical protein
MSPTTLFDFHPDEAFWTVGIVSALPDYRLAYFFNRQFETDFTRADDDFIKKNKAKEPCLFALFEHVDHDNKINWYLIQNRSFGMLHLPTSGLETASQPLPNPEFVMPSFPKFDYFLILCPVPPQKLQTQILKNLRSTMGVQFVQPCALTSKELKYLKFEPYYDH